MRIPVKIATVGVLILSLGLHWALLQTLAWSGMLLAYSRNNSWEQAVSMTFDGQHPCSVCQMIKQGRAEESRQEQDNLRPDGKLDLGLSERPPEFLFTSFSPVSPPSAALATARRDRPPTPPPRPASLKIRTTTAHS